MSTIPVSGSQQNELDVAALVWRKSTRSITHSNCVEVANASRGQMAVRDSKDNAGPVLCFPSRIWHSFVCAIKDGRFGDL
jgi:hypothetical protein